MIITNNEDALRVKCDDVLSEEVGDLISVLERELDYSNRLGRFGIGLAAPQIGIAKNIAIIRLGKDLNINLVNAKLKIGYNSTLFRQEGCLSFPGRVEDTIRYQEVLMQNSFSDYNSFVATGLLAVVCQHELDHLNSVLFTDRLANPIVKKNKLKPNDICNCGSNKKYKKCCGKL